MKNSCFAIVGKYPFMMGDVSVLTINDSISNESFFGTPHCLPDFYSIFDSRYNEHIVKKFRTINHAEKEILKIKSKLINAKTAGGLLNSLKLHVIYFDELKLIKNKIL
jgi:hypothetical protein